MTLSSTGRGIHKPRRGQGVHGGYYSLTTKSMKAEPRVACVVSKKVATRAVDRNKAKRVCRAIFGPYVRDIGERTLFVHVRKSALDAPHKELVKEASQLIKQVITPRD